MARIRHIAYRAEDTEAMAKFFVDGFGMQVVQRRGNNAIDLSDGVINITLLPMGIPGLRNHGIEHMGFTLVDGADAGRAVEAAGGRVLNTVQLGSEVHYEVKYEGPEGIVVDVGHWAGTAPIDDATSVEATPVS